MARRVAQAEVPSSSDESLSLPDTRSGMSSSVGSSLSGPAPPLDLRRPMAGVGAVSKDNCRVSVDRGRRYECTEPLPRKPLLSSTYWYASRSALVEEPLLLGRFSPDLRSTRLASSNELRDIHERCGW